MKFLFFGFLCLGSFVSVIAQEPTTSVQVPVDPATHLVTYGGSVKSDLPETELFNRAMEWLDTAFRYGGSEIRVADGALGKIISRQTTQLIISGTSYNVSFTLSMLIQDKGYKYKFTHIYFDRIGPGIPIVPFDDLIHTTKKQYSDWLGVAGFFGSLEKEVDKLVKPLDGCLKQEDASLNHSMERNVTR